MKLVAFGDSFVEGLIKDPHENPISEREEINFVNQIYVNSGIFDSVENYGQRGVGNEYIAHTVYKYIKTHDITDCFFLVVWSGLDRAAYYHPKKDRYVDTFRRKNEQIQRDPVFQITTMMLALDNIFKQRQVPYLFSNSFFPIKDYDEINSLEIVNYTEGGYRNNSLFDIITENFKTKSKVKKIKKVNKWFNHDDIEVSNKYIAACKHPSAEGHKKIAKTLTPYIQDAIEKH